MLELLTLFFLLPTAIYIFRFRVHAIPMLWILMAYCSWILWRTGNLSLARPDVGGLWQRLPSILAIFLPFVIVMTVLVERFAPNDLFSLVRKQPGLWGLVMVAYPLLSVYPQGIIYRAFFFDRYRGLFPNAWVMVVMSALAFAYVHVIFRNWLAVGLQPLVVCSLPCVMRKPGRCLSRRSSTRCMAAGCSRWDWGARSSIANSGKRSCREQWKFEWSAAS